MIMDAGGGLVHVVPCSLFLSPLELQGGHLLLVDGGLLLVKLLGLDLVHGGRGADFGSGGSTACRTQLPFFHT